VGDKHQLKNGAMATSAPEPGKIVNDTNSGGPEMGMNVHNQQVPDSIKRSQSSGSDNTTSSRTSRKSKIEGFLDRLVSGKHAKK
jgi:hypothetical protein